MTSVFPTCSTPAPRPLRRLALALRAALPAAVVLSIAGCDNPDKFAPACPSLAFLRDAADLTRFAPSGQDVTDMVLEARLTAVPASCQRDEDDPGKVVASLHVSAEVTRGPAARDRVADLTYVVGITEQGKELTRQKFPLHVTFPPNADRVNVTDDEVDLLLPVTKDKTAAVYKIYVAFLLTPDELAYNRRRDSR
jgi:hypothetical protein